MYHTVVNIKILYIFGLLTMYKNPYLLLSDISLQCIQDFLLLWNYCRCLKKGFTIVSSWYSEQATFTAVVDKCVVHSFAFIVDAELMHFCSSKSNAEVIPEVCQLKAEPSIPSRKLNLVASVKGI